MKIRAFCLSVFCLLLIALFSETTFGYTYNRYNSYDDFKVRIEETKVINCADYTPIDFEERGCYTRLVEFFENYIIYKILLNDENGFNGVFDNNVFVIKLFEQYFKWTEYKKEKLREKGNFYISDYLDNQNSFHGLLLLKREVSTKCAIILQDYDFCGGEANEIATKIREEYKEVLEESKSFFQEKIDENKENLKLYSIELAKIGMHMVGYDNNIIYSSFIDTQDYINTANNAKKSFEFQESCVQNSNGYDARITCAENAILLARNFDKIIFGNQYQNQKENQMIKLKKILYYQEIKIAHTYNKTSLFQFYSEAGNTVLNIVELFKDDPDKDSVVSSYLDKSLQYFTQADDRNDWGNAFNLKYKIILHKEKNNAFSIEGYATLLVIILFFVVFFSKHSSYKQLEIIRKTENRIDSIFENHKKELIGMAATMWVGFTFAFALEAQVFQIQQDILTVDDLSSRMIFLHKIDNGIKNAVLFIHSWIFLSIASIFLILSIILYKLNDRIGKALFWCYFYMVIISLILTLYAIIQELNPKEGSPILLFISAIIVSVLFWGFLIPFKKREEKKRNKKIINAKRIRKNRTSTGKTRKSRQRKKWKKSTKKKKKKLEKKK